MEHSQLSERDLLQHRILITPKNILIMAIWSLKFQHLMVISRSMQTPSTCGQDLDQSCSLWQTLINHSLAIYSYPLEDQTLLSLLPKKRISLLSCIVSSLMQHHSCQVCLIQSDMDLEVDYKILNATHGLLRTLY